MRAKILKILTEKHKKSGGNCGLSIIGLADALEIDFNEELKAILNQLYKEQKITTKEGLNGILIFIKEEK